jgi:two-component system, OmpR family, response regulator
MSMGPPLVGRRDFHTELLRGLHVLVVDEDEVVRQLLAAIIAHSGALVTEAASVTAASESFERVRPELIVAALDLDAGRGAHAVLAAARVIGAHGRHIPVIAFARATNAEPMHAVLEAGFDGYSKAPLDPTEFCELIAAVAERRRL